MSIIFGILIDAFGELRENEDAAKKELKSKCFTCEISKKDVSLKISFYFEFTLILS